MVRNVDYESRRRAILAAAINKYIKDAVPVASDTIAEDFDLSSATIRNIFSELEESGYLKHLYTSGGRVPTNKGYRYYVDFLISQLPDYTPENEPLLQERARRFEEYKKDINRLEDTLEKASEIISEVTHQAGIASFIDWHDRLFYKGMSLILEQPEFQDVARMRILIKIIEDKQRLLDIINRDFGDEIKIYIGEELGCPEMQECSLVVSSYRLKSRPSGRLAVLGPVRMEYKHVISTLGYISNMLTRLLNKT